MMYSGENILVPIVESKIHDGCRIILNRSELIRLQYLEWCIFETIIYENQLSWQPIILNQFEIFIEYLDRELSKMDSPPRTSEEMIIFIKNLRDDHIITSSPKHDINLISQLKMHAFTYLVEHSIQRWNREMSPELFNGNMSSLTSPTNIVAHNTFNIQNEKKGDAESYDSIHDLLQSFDLNDGPNFFNTQPSPHTIVNC